MKKEADLSVMESVKTYRIDQVKRIHYIGNDLQNDKM